jgi:hypothetical protein
MKRRDKLSDNELDVMFAEARLQIDNGEDPDEVLLNEFSLEPDYIFDLLEETGYLAKVII